jgi:hypothetical protein
MMGGMAASVWYLADRDESPSVPTQAGSTSIGASRRIKRQQGGIG